jgi:hypothetical protein
MPDHDRDSSSLTKIDGFFESEIARHPVTA